MNPTEIAYNIGTWLSVVIQVITLITLIKTFGQFLNKPNKTQNGRLDALEEWRDEVERRLQNGNSHFDEIDQGNRITQKALLALMAHAINGNDIQKLETAKNELESYLIDK